MRRGLALDGSQLSQCVRPSKMKTRGQYFCIAQVPDIPQGGSHSELGAASHVSPA